MDTTTTQPATVMQHRPGKAGRIIIIVFVIALLGVGVWYIVRHFYPAKLSPQETLIQLEQSSDPVTMTEQERVELLNVSAPMTEQEQVAQLAILNSLKQ